MYIKVRGIDISFVSTIRVGNCSENFVFFVVFHCIVYYVQFLLFFVGTDVSKFQIYSVNVNSLHLTSNTNKSHSDDASSK